MLLTEEQLATLTDGSDVLADEMIRHDARPILLFQSVVERVADPDSGEIVEHDSGLQLTKNYITSPKIRESVALQTHLEKVLELISPKRQCSCVAEKERLERMLYGDGNIPPLSLGIEEMQRGVEEGKFNLTNLLKISGLQPSDDVDQMINDRLAELQKYAGLSGLAYVALDKKLQEEVVGLVDFKDAYTNQQRVIGSHELQIPEFTRRLGDAKKTLDKWPKNNPIELTTSEVVTCGRCKRTVPVPLSIVYADDTTLDPISQIIFERPWTEMREILPMTQIKVLLTAVYVWAFKPLEDVTNPFARNMREIMGVVEGRVPKNRRWLRYIMEHRQIEASRDETAPS